MTQRLPFKAFPLLLFRSFYELWQVGKQYVLILAGLGIALIQFPTVLIGFSVVIASGIAWITYKYYQQFQYELPDSGISLRFGVFSHHDVRILNANVERYEITQNLLEKGLGLTTLILFTQGSQSPAMTINYINQAQMRAILDHIGIKKDVQEPINRPLGANLFYGMCIGHLYPYLTIGLIITIPLSMLLNVIHQPPAPSPIAARDAIADTISMGLLPLMANIVALYIAYIVIGFIGKVFAFLVKYSTATFTISATGTVSGETGLFRRTAWRIDGDNIHYFKVQTNALLERFGRFNVTIIPISKADGQMMIPGVKKADLNRLLSLKGIDGFARHEFKRPPIAYIMASAIFVFFSIIFPVYALLLYVIPAQHVTDVTLHTHVIILCLLFTAYAFYHVIAYRNAKLKITSTCSVIGAKRFVRTYYCVNEIDIIAKQYNAFSLLPVTSIDFVLANTVIKSVYFPSQASDPLSV